MDIILIPRNHLDKLWFTFSEKVIVKFQYFFLKFTKHAAFNSKDVYVLVFVKISYYHKNMSFICSAQSENLDNSGIALRKVRIPKLADRVRILTLRGTIPELSVRKVRIGTK